MPNKQCWLQRHNESLAAFAVVTSLFGRGETYTNSDIMLELPEEIHAANLATQMTMLPYKARRTLAAVLTRARSFRAFCRDWTAFSAS